MTLEDLKKTPVGKIKSLIEAEFPPSENLLQMLEADARLGVQKLAQRFRNQIKHAQAEKARLEQMCALENKFRTRGETYIAGVDEAGRGPLAGPVVAAAVIFPPEVTVEGLNDSKKLSEQKREALFEDIKALAISIGIGEATPAEIDKINIRNATHLAMCRAISQLHPSPNRVLVDGNAVPESGFNEMAIIGGDRKSLSIAAASIIAKVTRDRQMAEYAQQYPQYGFEGHKGYGSADHLAALQEHGPSPIHRLSFGGVPHSKNEFSEDYLIFLEGIHNAQTHAQLKAIGETISTVSNDLPQDEIEALREHYAKRLAKLNQPGRHGENIATTYLKKKGFTIVEKNFRALGGEIDIIATKGQILSFIEVKTASQDQFGSPETWVNTQKQHQIIKIARAYLSRNAHPNLQPQFDVITVVTSSPTPQINYLPNAFQEMP